MDTLSKFEDENKTASVVLPTEDYRCANILRRVVRNLTNQGMGSRAASIIADGDKVNEVAELRKYLFRSV